MAEDTPLTYEEFLGELREFYGRVVGVRISDQSGAAVLRAEGEFSDLVREGDGLSFQIGGVPPRDREGLRFFATSYSIITIAQLDSSRRLWGGIGAVTLRAVTAGGLQIDVWPAMPPTQQYTEMHDDNR